MRFIVLFVFSLFIIPLTGQSQCTTSDATGCSCKTIGSTDCDLLPDIKCAEAPLLVTGSFGVIEYSQSGNGADDGRLRISASTPNIGHGPLELHSTNIYICGPDTFIGTPPSICANGTDPKILINQRIYHKNGTVMSYYDRPAGSMTYHPSHGHMHVDDWGIFTLRKEDTLISNPLQWPIIGDGAKLAFCLMDYGTCSFYSGHCVDDSNQTMLNGNFPNWGLGGGSYSCSPIVQGISSGYTDIYYQALDGMWIDIPPGTCNGDYYIIVEIDPLNYFLEENENNNIQVVPFTLTQQSTSASSSISYSGSTTLCQGELITLTASLGNSYIWSNGATTQNITVGSAGSYSVTVDSDCGISTTAPVSISLTSVTAPTTTNDTLVNPGNATLIASGIGSGGIKWYDAQTGGNLVNTGATFITPVISNSTTFYAEDVELISGQTNYSPPHDNTIGTGANHTNTQRYLIFDVHKPITLKSVKVYSGAIGNRDIELRDATGALLQTATVSVLAGEHRINLNFNILPGLNYQLGISSATNPNFYRNSAGVNYPYSINGLVDITGSEAGSSYYYFYYDWEVKEQDLECSSLRTSANVVVLNPTSIDEINYNDIINVYPNPSSGMVSISIENVAIQSLVIRIIDVSGKEVMKFNDASNMNTKYLNSLDLRSLSKGFYTIQIAINNNIVTKSISLE